MENTTKQKQGNGLIFLGLVLFILGLLIGLFVQNMANPRMALSAHLEGIMNGMFLMIVGVIWPRLILSNGWLKGSYLLLIYSTFANVLAVLIAAIAGAGKMMPIAGGQEGSVAMEAIINFLLISLSLALLFACVVILIGYYRYMQQKDIN
jgi:(hydroxyamino)benzene mutase